MPGSAGLAAVWYNGAGGPVERRREVAAVSEQARARTPAAALRATIAAGTPALAPFVAEPLASRLVERLGFAAGYLGGGALGYLLCTTEARLTSSDVVEATRRITAVCGLPLIVDGTTGFGEAIHVLRTVRELEHAGAAGVEIEDQLTPKHAHHHRGVDHPIPLGEMVEKVQAAVEARRDPDFLIIARTNTIAEVNVEEAIRRANAYAEAGADLILVLPRNEEEFRRLPKEIDRPLVAMTMSIGRPPRLSPQELRDLGYVIVIEPQGAMLAAYAAMRDAYTHLLADGFVPWRDNGPDLRALRTEIDELCDLPRLWALEEQTTERPERLQRRQ